MNLDELMKTKALNKMAVTGLHSAMEAVPVAPGGYFISAVIKLLLHAQHIQIQA